MRKRYCLIVGMASDWGRITSGGAAAMLAKSLFDDGWIPIETNRQVGKGESAAGRICRERKRMERIIDCFLNILNCLMRPQGLVMKVFGS